MSAAAASPVSDSPSTVSGSTSGSSSAASLGSASSPSGKITVQMLKGATMKYCTPAPMGHSIRCGRKDCMGCQIFKATVEREITLDQDISFDLPAGTKVYIDGNSYCVVQSFASELWSLPGYAKRLTKITLPAGTRVKENNGIPMAVVDPLEVEVIKAKFMLPAATKLQSGKAIQCTLPTACEAKADTDTYDTKSGPPSNPLFDLLIFKMGMP